MKSTGMVFRSTAVSPGTPETKRRPLTSTRVRESPRLRRLTVDTPPLEVRKFELVRLSVGVPIVGFLSSKSCKLVTPDAAISAAVRTCSGDGDSAPGDEMRELVICTCCGASLPDCAYAACILRATPPTQIMRNERDKTVSFIMRSEERRVG